MAGSEIDMGTQSLNILEFLLAKNSRHDKTARSRLAVIPTWPRGAPKHRSQARLDPHHLITSFLQDVSSSLDGNFRNDLSLHSQLDFCSLSMSLVVPSGFESCQGRKYSRDGFSLTPTFWGT